MRIVIEDVPESLNKVLRMHWAARKRYNDRWYTLVRAEVPPVRRKKVKAHIFYSQMRKRLLDDDNLHGSTKPITDALKSLGYLYDDSPQWLTTEWSQQTGPRKMIAIEMAYDYVRTPMITEIE